ncbi:uncharacterized protein LOC143182675 isoform X2 [Calliopsis andreniformis]|uniref:uncharacterized protein LOC143182675 isoform X2 n=1 Tax=Calliopsis andreniformis TaxID=337506 RepID=UPI003FCDAF4E
MEIENKAKILSDNIGNLCRVCLTMNQNNQCIFDTKQNESNYADNTSISEKFRLCSGVEITESDGLPATICMKCIIKVSDAYQLRKQCQQSDIQLKKLYETNTAIMNDNTYPTVNCNSNIQCVEEQKILNESNHIEYNAPNNHVNNVKCRQTGYEKKEAYRTRRTTMFKRVTSMENLKNHKERQRQYIKKNVNIKRDILDNDCLVNINEQSTNSYTCLKCDRHYSSKKSLDKHVSTHEEKKFTCDKCNKQFFQLDKLIKHSKLHKVKEKLKPVLCRICNKTFKKTDTMVRHLNVHKRANPKEVLSILKEIRDKRKLENINKSEEKNMMVGSNNDKTEIEEGIVNNGMSTLNTHIKCSLKSEHTSSKGHLSYSNTNLSIHVEKRFVCSVCNMKFYRQDRLESHKNRYGHNEDKASLESQKPSDEKSAIKLINSWIREELDSDNEEKGFPCKICGKSYDTKRSLLKHHLNMHNSQTEGCRNCGNVCVCEDKDKDQQKNNEILKSYRCDECSKPFETEIKLQRHRKIHERSKEQKDTNFKRFLCHICSKTFRQNTGLMFHMRTHTGYKPHVCKYCGRGFTSNSNCINHERTHTGDRPFVCHFCSAAFAKSCTLKAHITTHTGEANYHCKTCGKSFRRLKYLKEHRFTHTGEKPYACKICGTAYSHNGSLFVHEKKCKAQYQNAQNYCQSEIASPNVTPIITILPQTHLNEVILPLNSQDNKTYANDIQRISSPSLDSVSPAVTPNLQIHPNSETSDVSLAVKNFALIGHMFQS